MGASSTQFDIQAGLDLSALTTATLSQVMQAINQLAPLSDIGGIVVFDGGAGTSWPGVTNNPRFKRYIWLDTNGGGQPTAKIYDQSGADGFANWPAQTVANLSITNAKVATNAAIDVTKLAFGTARYIVRTNAAGTALEFCNPNALFATNDIPLSVLDTSAAPADNSILQRIGGIVLWSTYDPSGNVSGLAPTRIAPGPKGSLLFTDLNQTVGWIVADDLNNNFLIVGSATTGIPVNKLSSNSGNPNQVIATDGNIVAWRTPVFGRSIDKNSKDESTPLSLTTIAGSAYSISNTFGVTPSFVRATLYCTQVDGSFAVGDEFDISVLSENAASHVPIGAIFANASNIKVAIKTAGGGLYYLVNPGTGAMSAAITPGRWSVRIIAAI